MGFREGTQEVDLGFQSYEQIPCATAPWPVRQWMGTQGGAAPAGRSGRGWRRRAGTRGGGGHTDGGEAAVEAPQFRERPQLSPPQSTTKV